jgi:hypothetical protein
MIGFHWLGEEYTPKDSPKDCASEIMLQPPQQQQHVYVTSETITRDVIKWGPAYADKKLTLSSGLPLQ